MIRRLTMSLAMAAFAWAVPFSANASDKVPTLDVEKTCHDEVMNPDAASTRKICIQDEETARAQLEQKWAEYPAKYRKTCLAETNMGGGASYVDVLTCIQMFISAEEVEKVKQKGSSGEMGVKSIIK